MVARNAILLTARDAGTDDVFGFTPAPGDYPAPDPEFRFRAQQIIFGRLAPELTMLGEGHRRFEIRWVRTRRYGAVEIAILAAVASSSAAAGRRSAVAAARRYASELVVLLTDLAPGLDWIPITSPRILRHTLRPFRIHDAAAIVVVGDAEATRRGPGPIAPEAITRTAELTGDPFVMSIALRTEGRVSARDAPAATSSPLWLPGPIAVLPAGQVATHARGAVSPWTFRARVVIAGAGPLPGPLLSAAGAEVRGHGQAARPDLAGGPYAPLEWERLANIRTTLAAAEEALARVDVDWPARHGMAGSALGSWTLDLDGAAAVWGIPARRSVRQDGQPTWPRHLIGAPVAVPLAGLSMGWTLGEPPAAWPWQRPTGLWVEKGLHVAGHRSPVAQHLAAFVHHVSRNIDRVVAGRLPGLPVLGVLHDDDTMGSLCRYIPGRLLVEPGVYVDLFSCLRGRLSAGGHLAGQAEYHGLAA